MSKQSEVITEVISQEKIFDDGTAPVFQVDTLGGVMASGKGRNGLVKLNLCQDLPIQDENQNAKVALVQKRVASRLVLTTDAFLELVNMLNSVAENIKNEAQEKA